MILFALGIFLATQLATPPKSDSNPMQVPSIESDEVCFEEELDLEEYIDDFDEI